MAESPVSGQAGGSGGTGSSNVSPKKRASTGGSSEEVQRQTFTRWINAQLVKLSAKNKRSDPAAATAAEATTELVSDLFVDLRDGKRIVRLLQSLTGEVLKMEKGKMRVHQITNINRALQFLEREYNLAFNHMNIGAEDLADGSPRLTLGFVWQLILRFQVQAGSGADDDEDDDSSKTAAQAVATGAGGRRGLMRQSSVDVDLKKDLLDWCKSATKSTPGVDVTNFRASWYSGLAFLAIVRRFYPDMVPLWPPGDDVGAQEAAALAFQLAEERAGVYPLLDAADVVQKIVDEQSMVTYLAMLRQELGPIPDESAAEFPSQPASISPVGRVSPIQELDLEVNEGPMDPDAKTLSPTPEIEAVPVQEVFSAVLVDQTDSGVAFVADEFHEEEAELTVAAATTDENAVPADSRASTESTTVSEAAPLVVVAEETATAVNSDTTESPPAVLGNEEDVGQALPVATTTGSSDNGSVPLEAGWWPWLGLVPLAIALSYELAKHNGVL